MNPIGHYHLLKTKIEERNSEIKSKIVEKHREAFSWAATNTKQIAAGAMGSLILLSSPAVSLLPSSSAENHTNEQFADIPENLFMVNDLKQYLPQEVGILLPGQEEKIGEILSTYYGFSVKPELEGKRLLHTYGYIGAEQHLMRYPGDIVENMAPGRGAFGYFTFSHSELTQREIDKEKYYIAVQTFLAKDYATRTREYVDFFKFRKMLIVNPNTGRAVVAVIGDAGPAVWTKKHLGGSPEVMEHLQRVDGKAKGPVLYFFIDDPEDKIPLGPIEPTKA